MAYSAIILAGGKGKRMGYQEKALMAFNGKPLITYVIKSLRKSLMISSFPFAIRHRKSC